jgi:serine/threonine protein kinase
MTQPGELLCGRYRIERLLGQGGMADVFRAIDTTNGEAVAVKLVRSSDPGLARRLAQEAKALASLDHPGLVRLLDAGVHGEQAFLVMELVDGPTLSARLRRGPLSPNRTAVLGRTIADALAYVHAQGIVHRDVKPGNVLLDTEGNVYITDFGLAKDTQGSVLTLPGQALGSMDYMAPEQIRGEAVAAATDLYALGCVMFECLHGLPPFADRQGMRVLWAHLQDEPPDPTGVSEQVSMAIKSALQKAPEDRPKSVTEYARKLSLAAGIPVADVA